MSTPGNPSTLPMPEESPVTRLRVPLVVCFEIRLWRWAICVRRDSSSSAKTFRGPLSGSISCWLQIVLCKYRWIFDPSNPFSRPVYLSPDLPYVYRKWTGKALSKMKIDRQHISINWLRYGAPSYVILSGCWEESFMKYEGMIYRTPSEAKSLILHRWLKKSGIKR